MDAVIYEGSLAAKGLGLGLLCLLYLSVADLGVHKGGFLFLVHCHRSRRYVVCLKACDEHVKQLLYLVNPPDRGAVFLMAEVEEPEDHLKSITWKHSGKEGCSGDP